MKTNYIEPTQESGKELFKRDIQGEVVMLNLLRFRDIADYSNNPELSPESSISGKEAFQKYIDHTIPFLERSGGELLFLGEAGKYFIGPSDENWDLVMLVKQRSVQSFFAFAGDPECMEGKGHRTAAIIESRSLSENSQKSSNRQIRTIYFLSILTLNTSKPILFRWLC